MRLFNGDFESWHFLPAADLLSPVFLLLLFSSSQACAHYEQPERAIIFIMRAHQAFTRHDEQLEIAKGANLMRIQRWSRESSETLGDSFI